MVVFQRGGADGLQLVVPYGEGRYFDLRPAIALPGPGAEGGVLDLDGFFGLHPSLAPLLPAWEAGELAIVHAAGAPDDTRSHFEAQDHMDAGVLDKGLLVDGWLNRHLQALEGAGTPFQAVGIGNALPLSLQGAAPALGLSSVEGFDLLAPPDAYGPLRKALLSLYGGTTRLDDEAVRAFEAIDGLQGAVDEIPEPAAAYPASPFGLQLATVAQLVKADLGLEVATVDIGGWDHHDRQNQQLAPLAADFAASLAAFREDLGADFGRVTVVTMTEFGRRVAENGSAGTDHGHGSVMLALGGGVLGGRVVGDWPGLSEQALYRGDLAITTDFRTVLSEALRYRRGVSDVAGVFPGFEGPIDLGLFAPVVA